METEAQTVLTQMPVALGALKEWSIWLVGLQTGVIGLVLFISGKEGMFKLDGRLARGTLLGAICCFAMSIVAASWVLAGIPSILTRMSSASDGFYDMPLIIGELFGWEITLPDLWVFTSAEHLFFIGGILLFMVSIIGAKMKVEQRDSVGDQAGTRPTQPSPS